MHLPRPTPRPARRPVLKLCDQLRSLLLRANPALLAPNTPPQAWSFQPENAIKLKPWKGDPQDTGLLDLLPFLQYMATHRIRDVRDVVRSYDGVESVPAAFRQRLQEAAMHQKQQQRRGLLGGR